MAKAMPHFNQEAGDDIGIPLGTVFDRCGAQNASASCQWRESLPLAAAAAWAGSSQSGR
jgi:hypothetical protein